MKQSKGENRRVRKRRGMKAQAEIEAFRKGMEAGREIVGKQYLTRVMVRAGAVGFVLGACSATATLYAVLRW